MNDLDDEQVARAVAKFIRTFKQVYPGTNVIAVLREFAFDFDSLPNVNDAWKEVRKNISVCGFYQKPQWSHELIEHSVSAFGWSELCNSENPEASRAHFFKIFDGELSRYKNKILLGEK